VIANIATAGRFRAMRAAVVPLDVNATIAGERMASDELRCRRGYISDLERTAICIWGQFFWNRKGVLHVRDWPECGVCLHACCSIDRAARRRTGRNQEELS
jgi:hypothetical protein